MSRQRTHYPPSSRHITPEGRQKLQDEFDYLWKSKRPEVLTALSAAAAEGDRSENAEYIYRKKQLREIDSRIRHLTGRLEVVKVVDCLPDDPSRVYFGAWVKVEDEEGETFTYRIVGPDEFDHARGLISMDSPVARSLLGKSVGDEVLVQRPKGEAFFTILKVWYEGVWVDSR